MPDQIFSTRWADETLFSLMKRVFGLYCYLRILYVGLIAGMSMLGIGTALVYPTLLAGISDSAHPNWRTISLGVYKFWRDLGFVFGAVGIDFIADIFNLNIAIQVVAWISLGSGLLVFVFMQETRKSFKTIIKK